jgi:hypothetical protein
MDFASTLRVLAKHKVLVAVLLLLTVGAAAWGLTVAAQTKEASGSYVLLSAPQPQPVAEGEAPIVANNPFSAMDQSTVVDVLRRSMETDQVALELKDQGLAGTYRVAGNQDFVRGPLLDLAVTSPTTDEALAGYELLATEVSQTLRQRQIDAGANPAYLMSMQRVSDPVVSTPGLVGRIRLGIAILAVGLIITLGVTLVVESLSRRRRRHSESDEGEPGEASSGEGEADVEWPGEGVDHAQAESPEESEVDRETTAAAPDTSPAADARSTRGGTPARRASRTSSPSRPNRS